MYAHEKDVPNLSPSGGTHGSAHKFQHREFIWTTKNVNIHLHAIYLDTQFIVNQDVSFFILLKKVHFITTQYIIKIY